MKLIYHVVFIFFILNNLSGFAYARGDQLKNKSLLDYAMKSGDAWRSCSNFAMDENAIYAYCDRDFGSGPIFKGYPYHKMKGTGIPLKSVALAKKNKHKIENIKGALRVRK